MGIISSLIVSFCALFIAVDAIGLLPVYSLYTQDLKLKQKKQTLRTSLYVAAAIAVALLISGRLLGVFLGIRPHDFQIAGGALMFILSVYALVKGNKTENIDLEKINIFPIAAPIIIKPVLISMILVSMASYGLIVTSLGFAANMLLLYAVFKNEKNIYGTLGDNGVELISKLLKVLISFYSLMIIRKGLSALFYAAVSSAAKLQ